MVNVTYASFCGPAAVGAIADIPTTKAARLLLAIRRRRGLRDHDGRSTRPPDMAAALIHLGLVVVPYSGVVGEPPMMSAAEFRRHLVDPPKTRDWVKGLSPESRAAALEERGRLKANPPPASPPDRYYRVSELRAGTWLAHTTDHVCAVRDGTILSGRFTEDGDVSDHEVQLLHRVFNNGEGS